MDLELNGKTAIITGGSKGIGRAVAEVLAAEGCHLHLVARTEETLAATATALRAAHQINVTTHALDLSDSASIETLLAAVPAPDVLVNNAGAIPGGDVEAVDEATWRAAWDLKVFGYINMTRAYYRVMRERGSGVIVNVIGLAGERFDANYVAGTTGNASLMAFTRAVGSTSLTHGVRVLACNPGAVETERLVGLMQNRSMTEHGTADRWREYLANLPMKRAAKPREVADLVAFLASARASYLSGIVVTLDGGLAARASSF